MPRIAAKTVAEHRSRQHEVLLDAAREIILEEGYEALTFRLLGERTDLARNSIYRYFDSRDDIVGQLCEREMPAWLDELADAIGGAETSEDLAATYVTSQLIMVAAGRHELAHALATAPLGPELRARIATFPDQASQLLEDALAGAGHPEPRLTAQFVTGVLNAAIRLSAEAPAPLGLAESTADAARRLVRAN